MRAATSTTEQCKMKPDMGVCRALFSHWFYNDTSGRCEKFIYGGCKGNKNNFQTADDCYSACNQEASPCKNKKCGDGEKCVVDSDRSCLRGKCRLEAVCTGVNGILVSGISLPECQNGQYKLKQCYRGYCWCVSPEGKPHLGSLTRGELLCDQNGAKIGPKFLSCSDGSEPRLHCLMNACVNATCPGHPEAQCVANLCVDDCDIKFYNETHDIVKCEADSCKVMSGFPKPNCPAPKACADGSSPHLCSDGCVNAKCPANPCAVCVTDQCTCRAVFIDSATNKTIQDCSKMTITKCQMEKCRRLADRNRDLLINGNSSIILPACASSGSFEPRQCNSRGCYCVNGYGQRTRYIIGSDNSCVPNDTLALNIKLKFPIDFSTVENSIPQFKQVILEKLTEFGIDKEPTEIKVTKGSTQVSLTYADSSNQPDPLLGSIHDLIQTKVYNQEFQVEWRRQTYAADPVSFQADSLFQASVSTTTSTPVTTTLKPTTEGLAQETIIIIAAVCGVVGLAVLIGIIVCCCRVGITKEKKEEFNSTLYDKPQSVPSFAVTNALYGNMGTPYSGPPGQQLCSTMPSTQEMVESEHIKVRL